MVVDLTQQLQEELVALNSVILRIAKDPEEAASYQGRTFTYKNLEELYRIREACVGNLVALGGQIGGVSTSAEEIGSAIADFGGCED